MSTVIASIGPGSYTGTLTIGPGVSPSIVGTAGIQIECSQWTGNTSSATVTLELSQDGGQTYQPWCTGVFTGGALDRSTRLPLGTAIMNGGVPPSRPGASTRT